MSSQLKTAVVVDDSAIVDGNTIDASNHTNPLEDAQDQLREGQASVSASDTHVKHLEDAIVGVSGKVKATKLNPAANEQIEIDLDASGVPSGYNPTANGSGGWAWAAAGGGGAQPVDVTGTADEDLSERDFVYLDESLGTWRKVDTNDTPVRCGRLRGFVNEAGGITATNSGSIRLIGEVSGFTGLTAWDPVYADTLDGTITQTRPSPSSGGTQVAIILIGFAVSVTNILILPPIPVQYMKRNNNLADDALLSIEHHVDAMAHTRRAFAYIGSSESGVSIAAYPSSNQDTDVALNQTFSGYTGDLTSGEATIGDLVLVDGLTGVFDDDNATYGAKNSVAGTAGIDFGSGNDKAITQYTLTCDAGATNEPRTWTFQYSSDNSSWTTVDTQTDITSWSGGEKKTFQFSNVVAARYWRISITNSNQSGLRIAELEMMEDLTIDPKAKLAQTFTLANATDIATAMLYLKKVGSPTGTGTVRIETVSGGDPTGTLADANATGTFSESALSTSYTEITVTFADSFNLSAGTYALVLSTDRSASETNYIHWGADESSPSFTGEMQSEESSVWSDESKDAVFTLTSPGTTFVEPAILGRWSGGTRDVAIRYDDGAGGNINRQTTCKNVVGAAADITLVVEVP